jgi:capsular exopolysaccharide synthesis family protein
MENTLFEKNEVENKTDVFQQIFKYLRYWYYFLISIIICFFGVKYYLNHTVPIYESKAAVKIIDDSKNSFSLPTNGISLFARTKINLDNEIEILKSHRILEKVSENLDLNTKYFKAGYFNKYEIWKNRPFTIEWMLSPELMENKSISFEFEIDNDGYRITNFKGKEIDKTIPFGSLQYLNDVPYKLVLQVGVDKKAIINHKYLISHSPLNSTIVALSNSVKIVNSNEKSDILIISTKGSNKDKSEAIINEVIKQYDNDGVSDRRLVSQRTIDFVNNRFKSIVKDLDSIETKKANYKRNNELIFLEADAATVSEGKINAKADVFHLETQIALSRMLVQNIQSEKKYNLIPNNLGVESVDINELVNNFNAVVLERDRLLVSAGLNNPKIGIINDKLNDLQKNILQSIKIYQQQLIVSLSKNNYIKKSASDKFSAIPNDEKILNGIERQRNIKEALYILLLQKREEAAVNLAITSSSIKVIDYALTDSNPVSPIKSTFYLGSIIIGLLIPFLILFIIYQLDDKLHDKEDVERYAKNKVIIAEIPHIDSVDRLTGINDRSLLGESFRILRTNLSYVMPLKTDDLGQVVMVTSTIKGEGKTFTTLNLSISFSLMNKKVLLIGSDLRNPQLHNYLNIKKSVIGLQDYLHDMSIDWKSLINSNQLNNKNLDIIPPNPAELLSNGRLEKLINEAKQEYDFIIIDTAPTLLVTDTLLISQLVDTTLYVLRAGFTPKKILEYSVGLSDRKKLKNMVYVINNIGLQDAYGYNYRYTYKYNYGYGYGYDDQVVKKNLFQKVLSFFAKK